MVYLGFLIQEIILQGICYCPSLVFLEAGSEKTIQMQAVYLGDIPGDLTGSLVSWEEKPAVKAMSQENYPCG